MGMLDRETFYARKAICKVCDSWSGVCRRGHALQSAQGCPLKRFPPVFGADYAPDRPLVAQTPQLAGCCGGSKGEETITWTDVVRQFAEAMLLWAKEGFPTVSRKTHAIRYAKCRLCPFFLNFYCRKCKCVAYLKSKLATESCPDDPPRWPSASGQGS